MKAQSAPKLRGFQLHVVRDGGGAFGVQLYETSDVAGSASAPIVQLDPRKTWQVMDAILDAVRASGVPRGQLSADRTEPIRLDEAAGVRLALLLLAAAPVVRPSRVAAMAASMRSLTAEEAYYWYAKCVGRDGARMRRALRLFLAEE